MSKVGVDRAADELNAHSFEFGALIVKLADLSGAHEGEIKGPEEKNNVLASELL